MAMTANRRFHALILICAVLGAGLGALRVSAAHAETTGERILGEASKWSGRPYCWDGGEPNGPTLGTSDPENGLRCGHSGYDPSDTPGFDCTGLTLYAVYQTTGKVLAHDPEQATNAVSQGGERVYDESELQVGDLVYFGGSFGDNVHAGVYAGIAKEGKPAFWSAVTEGTGVALETMHWEEAAESFVGAVRFSGGAAEGEGAWSTLLSYTDTSGALHAKEGGLGATWSTEYEGPVKSAAMATDPTNGSLLAAVNEGGTLYAKQGGLTASWIEELESGANSVAAASDASHGPLLAYTGEGGALFAKEGSLGATWTEELDSGAQSVAAASDPTNGPLLAYVGADGSLFAKEGGLGASWVEELGPGSGARALAVASDAKDGPLLAYIGPNGSLFAKEGGLGASWVEEVSAGAQSLAVASDSKDGPLLGYLGVGGNVSVKEGSLSAPWTEETTGASRFAVSSDATNGALLATVYPSGALFAKQGVGATWTEEVGSGANDVYLTGSAGRVAEEAPTIASPGPQVSAAGKPVVPVVVLGSRLAALTASNLPAGLQLRKASEEEWVIEGTPSSAATLTVALAPTNTEGAAGSAATFEWTVVDEPPPTLKKIAPAKGSASGGTRVTLSGANLEGVTEVMFGPSAATDIENVSKTEITVIAPAGTAGAAPITITTPEGASPSGKVSFKYESPSIASISPSSGPLAGGNTVTVAGYGFKPGTGTTGFLFKAAASTNVQCSSSTSCTVLVPPSTKAGVVDLIAAVGKAKSKKDRATDSYTYE